MTAIAARLNEMDEQNLSRILVIEDDPVIGTAAALALQEAGGFTVEVCCSGQKAVGAAKRFHPDLLLLDANLPGMDGPVTLQALRHQPDFSDLPVIFMTGRAHPDAVNGFHAMGALGVIAKPFDPMALAARVQTLWKGAHG